MIVPKSRASTVDSTVPLALQPAVDFPPVRRSIFDDPGDEKSWHISQRDESLSNYYAGREPSWYASAVEPLRYADRVLDIGCGPGLALEALLAQGCSSVLGVDRWPVFSDDSTATAPILIHDISLPMPFLESASFDGVLSHYALDYVSPICARQVFREAYRVLRPGGQLIVYVAAMGLGGGDEARTVSYSPQLLESLLLDAGFEEMRVEATSNGRNSVALARRSGEFAGSLKPGDTSPPRTAVKGDSQLSVSFAEDLDRLKLKASNPRRTVSLDFHLGDRLVEAGAGPSVCVRAQNCGPHYSELRIWAWRGHRPVLIERVCLEFPVGELRIETASAIRHCSIWHPEEMMVEPAGNAYARACDQPVATGLDAAEFGQEGRQVLVESRADVKADIDAWLEKALNRLRIARDPVTDIPALDEEWLRGAVHGVAIPSQALDGIAKRQLLQWASRRQCLIYLEGPDWDAILSAASQRMSDLHCPTILVDPALGNEGPTGPISSELVAFVMRHERFLVLLSVKSKDRSAPVDLECLRTQLLLSGPSTDGARVREASENLRYLAERTMLMRLRQMSGYSPAEVGRRAWGS